MEDDRGREDQWFRENERQLLEAAKVARIGYLSSTAPSVDATWLAAFEQGLRDLGYVEGKNLVLERRHAAGSSVKLDELAAELVRLTPDVIVT